MRKNSGTALAILLGLVSLALIAHIAGIAFRSTTIHNVVIAAGSPKAESFVLMRALKVVVESHYPHIKVVVHETGGTMESLALLERGEAQLVPAQGDGSSGAAATRVAVLFEDTFQLVVQKTANIHSFAELKGKRIALPTSGGQYQSFLFLAGHSGLQASDFTFTGADEEAANVAFASGDADALFRVRGLPNSFIQDLALKGRVELIPIDQVAALHIQQPAYRSAVIPKGTYMGNPPMPAQDIDTVGLERQLLARRDLDDDVVQAITEVLMDHRQELAAAIPESDAAARPLLAGIKRPGQGTGLAGGIHPGAVAFYDREQRTFVGSHLDPIALALAVFALIWLWSGVLRRSAEAIRLSRVNEYHSTVVQLIEEARSTDSEKQLEPIRAELIMLMTAAVRDLGNGRITEASFQAFRVIWQVAFDISRKHRRENVFT